MPKVTDRHLETIITKQLKPRIPAKLNETVKADLPCMIVSVREKIRALSDFPHFSEAQILEAVHQEIEKLVAPMEAYVRYKRMIKKCRKPCVAWPEFMVAPKCKGPTVIERFLTLEQLGLKLGSHVRLKTDTAGRVFVVTSIGVNCSVAAKHITQGYTNRIANPAELELAE